MRRMFRTTLQSKLNIDKEEVMDEAIRLVKAYLTKPAIRQLITAAKDALHFLLTTHPDSMSTINTAFFTTISLAEQIALPYRAEVSLSELPKHKLLYKTPYGDELNITLSFNTDKNVFSAHMFFTHPTVDYKYVEPPAHAQAYIVLKAFRILIEAALARILSMKGIRKISLIFTEEEIEDEARKLLIKLSEDV